MLAAGSRLGPYEIVALVGAGGMGEVYKARDTRLDRTVAVKVLPPSAAGEPARRKRFAKEARAISSLSHPHICPLYDVGEQDGRSFLVMEYLEGESMSDRLAKGPLPLDHALRHATEIAKAFAEAHERGVIHRDLKPANVMLTKKGAQLLDFGIAKLRAAAASEDAPTVSASDFTAEGVIVGTPQYMAPEQLEGKPVDARTDVFAFGLVLYEMVTGRKAFEASSRASLIAAILERDPPPPSQSQPGSPAWLDALVKRCLAKRPADRWQSFAEVLVQLDPRRGGEALAARNDRGRSRRASRRGVALAAIVAGLTAIGVALAWFQPWKQRRADQTRGPALKRLTADAGLSGDPAQSPDGRLVAFASDRAREGNLDIWVQQVAGGEPIRLTRHAADETTPDFSPDGTQIAFRSDRDGGGIYLVSALGGEPGLIAPQGYNPRFSPDGRWIAYHTGMPGAKIAGILRFGGGKLYIVRPTGGAPQQIQPTAKAASYSIWSPDSQHLLMLGSFETGIEPRDWWVTPLQGPATQVSHDPLRQEGLRGVYPTAWLAGNRIVFSAVSGDSRNSWIAALSPASWQIEGPVRRLTSGAGIEGATSVAASAPGMLRLAFSNTEENIDLWSIPLARDGVRTAGQPLRLTHDAFLDMHPALTGDGKTLVYSSERQGRPELWARDLTTGRETKLISMSPDGVFKPVLSPDGSKLAFWRHENEGRPAATFATDLRTAPDGTLLAGPPRQLPALAKEGSGWPWSWSPDGRAVWYHTARWPARAPNHLYAVATGQHQAEVAHPQHDFFQVLFSPDGRWLVFREQLSDNAVRLVATPMKDGKPAGEREWIPMSGRDVTVDWPAWSPAGEVVYFISARDGFVCVWAQRVASDTMRLLGAPVAIHHAHSARLSIGGVGPPLRGLAAARDKLVFNMSEVAGNIWMAEVQDGR